MNTQDERTETLKEKIQKIITGEIYFPVPIDELTNYDITSFKAGYKVYEKLLVEYLKKVLEQQ